VESGVGGEVGIGHFVQVAEDFVDDHVVSPEF
jgi:hypothetical protein